jgi:predicted dehydrogenase
MMFYLGCHLVDLVLQIQGIPEEVHAFNSSTGYGGIDSEDNSLALLKYKRGYSIVRVSGTEIAGFDRRQLVVMGDQGTIEIRPLETRIPDALRKTEYPQGCEKREALLVDGKSDTKNYSCEQYDRYESMMLAFGEMVRGEKKNPYTLEYELELFKIILKCCGM